MNDVQNFKRWFHKWHKENRTISGVLNLKLDHVLKGINSDMTKTSRLYKKKRIPK